MKSGTNRPKSLCKRDGKDASSACHWRNWKASKSAITPPRPSPTGITGARAGIVSNRLADFAGYGCHGPPCCQLRSKDRKAFDFREQSPPPGKFRFVLAHLPFGQFLDLGFRLDACGLFNLPTLSNRSASRAILVRSPPPKVATLPSQRSLYE